MGRAALARGDWPAARRAFEAALAKDETAEALEGLGLAAWWVDLADLVFESRERAYRMYRERGESAAAARVAVWLGWDSSAFRGDHAIASGWLQRARRLLDGQPQSREHAWLVLRAGVFALLDENNPEAAEQLALEALTQSLSITTFRYVPVDLRERIGTPDVEEYLNRLNQDLLTAVEQSGDAFLSKAVIAGKLALRACIVNFRTTREDLETVTELCARLGAVADVARLDSAKG